MTGSMIRTAVRDDVHVAKTVVMTLGFVLIALGAPPGAALLIAALADGVVIRSARRARHRTIRLAGLLGVVLGVVPAAVAVALRRTSARQDRPRRAGRAWSAVPRSLPTLAVGESAGPGGALGAKRRTNDLEVRRAAVTLDREERPGAVETRRHRSCELSTCAVKIHEQVRSELV